MNTDGACLPGGLEGVASPINHATLASCRPNGGNVGKRGSRESGTLNIESDCFDAIFYAS